MNYSYAAIVVALAATPVSAASFSYNFDGILSNHFTRLINDGQFFDQQNDQLEYNNNGNNPPVTDNVEAYSYDLFTPPYNQSWSASIDTTVPLSYDGIADTLNDAFAGAGLAAGFLPNGLAGSNSHIFSVLLDVDRFGGSTSRSVISDFIRDDVDIADGGINAAGVETTRVTVSFDAATKTLSTSSGVTPVFAIDIDEGDVNDWGMTNSDTFTLLVFAESGGADGLPVDPNTPLFLDNFDAGIVPEPSSYSLLVCAVLSLMGVPRSR